MLGERARPPRNGYGVAMKTSEKHCHRCSRTEVTRAMFRERLLRTSPKTGRSDAFRLRVTRFANRDRA